MTDLERLVDKVNPIQNPTERLNRCRESLQVLYLGKLYESGWFKKFAFMGGTCLRLCHGLERFSEDLDFVSLPQTRITPKRVYTFLNTANDRMQVGGFQVRMNKLNTTGNVWKVFVVFPGLLKLVGLSKDPHETLQVKIEIDTHPPSSFRYEAGMASDQDHEWIVPNVIKGTNSTLFGGKMHAVLFRKYAKGRDIFDLHWYLRRKTPLDIRVVEDTEVTLGRLIRYTREIFLNSLLKKLNALDMKKAESDVMPFVNQPEELQLVFDINRLRVLVNDILFCRSTTDAEYLEMLWKVSGLKKQSGVAILMSRVKSEYFEIRKALENEGVRLDLVDGNPLVGIIQFLKKQGKGRTASIS